MEENKKKRQSSRKARLKKRWAWACAVLALVFIIFVLGLSVAEVIMKDRTFSEQENRNLQQKPVFTMTGLMDKTWMDDIEAYIADQFVARDMWVSVKTNVDKLLGKKEYNGVLLGKEDYLMENPATPDEAVVTNNLEAVNQFADRHPDTGINFLVAPNAVYTLSELLPKGAPVRDQEADLLWIDSVLNDKVKVINVFSALKNHANEKVYYYTDHHWTTLGAYYAFQAAQADMGIEDVVTNYDIYTVTDSFEGTLASNSGYHKMLDTIEVFAPQDMNLEYIVSDSDDASKRPTVYDIDALDTKSKYEVFFGGNHATVDIQMVSQSERHLLIFKDSYANCFVPFLLPYYGEIIMVDPRYYYDNIEMIMDNYAITDVLFLYNMDTFMGDNSLADVLAGGGDSAEDADQDAGADSSFEESSESEAADQ